MSHRKYASLSAYFKATRARHREVAEKVGVTPSAISLYAAGKRTPRLATALKLARVCNVPVDTLLERAS